MHKLMQRHLGRWCSLLIRRDGLSLKHHGRSPSKEPTTGVVIIVAFSPHLHDSSHDLLAGGKHSRERRGERTICAGVQANEGGPHFGDAFALLGVRPFEPLWLLFTPR